MIAQKDIRIFHDAHRILQHENDFIYILPHPALREQISNYTVTFPNERIISDCYTVIPHGCATLVYSYGENSLFGNLFGPASKPCRVGSLANQWDMLVIIEFQPAGLSAFTGAQQRELANRTLPFQILNAKLDNVILGSIEISRTLDELVGRLDMLLWENLCAAYPAELKLAAKTMIQSAGNITCKDLSGAVYYSERHLNRIFENYLGMGVKTFSRMVRINRAIRLMHNPHCSLTVASCEAGFYDLPHFIHEFKSVCGLTPQEYKNNMSDFYNEIAKF